MNRSLTFPILFLVAACGATAEPTKTGSGDEPATMSDDAGTADPGTDENVWQDTAMQNLVATRCATSSCHGGARRPSFTNITEASMRANTSVATEVATGRMPRGSTLTAAEKKIVADFYAN